MYWIQKENEKGIMSCFFNNFIAIILQTLYIGSANNLSIVQSLKKKKEDGNNSQVI